MRSRGQGDEGFTLIEMLIVVMLLGVGFVAVLGGMATSMLSSTLHRDQAQAETEVRRYAEVIKEEPTKACPADYSTVAFTPTAKGPDGNPYTKTPPLSVRFVDNNGTVLGSCTATALQIVKVNITSADGKATETVEVLKRPA